MYSYYFLSNSIYLDQLSVFLYTWQLITTLMIDKKKVSKSLQVLPKVSILILIVAFTGFNVSSSLSDANIAQFRLEK